MSDRLPELLLLSGLPELALSAYRSGVVACAAVVVAHQIVVTLRGMRRSARVGLAIGLTAVPLLTPRCLIIYAYMTHAQAIATHPVYHELLYLALMLVILVPAATAFLAFAPPSPVAPSAVHCRRLARDRYRSVRGAGWFRDHRNLRHWTLAAVLTFLLAFTEMEMASLFGLRAWTVHLFDLQAGGLPITRLLGHALLPVLLAAGMLTVGVMLLPHERGAASPVRHEMPPPSPRRSAIVWIYLVGASVIAGLIPTVTTFGPTLGRAAETWSDLSVGEEVRNTLLFATVATLGVIAIVRLTHRPHTAPVLAALAWPGLLGALGLGLCLLALFQSPLLRPARDSPTPLLLGLILYLMPFALLLVAALHTGRPGPALHAASLLRAGPRPVQRRAGADIRWILDGRKWLFVVFILLLLASSDVILASLLAPSDMPTLMVLVYNQMHYGTSARLGTMVLIVSGLPLSILITALAAHRLVRRVPVHA